MTSTVYDYAWARPGVLALKAAGAVAVARYLSYDATGKNLTKAEADLLHANGIATVANWEWWGDWGHDFSGGIAMGVKHATAALAQYKACGAPVDALGRPTRPIYFSSDWDVTDAQKPTVANYYRGVVSVIGLAATGAYGGFHLIRYLFDHGVITWGLQTYGWSRVVDGVDVGPNAVVVELGGVRYWFDKRAQLRQTHNGVKLGTADTDLDEAQVADFGQWGVAAPKPAPKPTPRPVVAPHWPGRYLRLTHPLMHGSDVYAWQAQMIRRGWRELGRADGWFGPVTDKVVREFQREKRLGVDGIIGPKTWAAAWTAPIT